MNDVVRGMVEEILNGLLDAKAERLIGVGRHECHRRESGLPSGSLERGFDTRGGLVKLKMPKLRKLSFETSIIECYQRSESSVEEALIDVYHILPSDESM